MGSGSIFSTQCVYSIADRRAPVTACGPGRRGSGASTVADGPHVTPGDTTYMGALRGFGAVYLPQRASWALGGGRVTYGRWSARC